MRKRKHIGGFTLTELMTVTLIMSLAVVATILFFRKNITFYKRTQVRQEIMVDSRICMETILQYLRNAKPSSVVIRTNAAAALMVPNSEIEFDLRTPLPSGADSCRIYLTDGTIYIEEKTGGAGVPKKLVSHVKALMFTGDAADPAVVKVTLNMESSLNASTEASFVSSILLPNQEVHMLETAAP